MKELSVLFSEIYEVLAVPFTIYNRENHVISFLPKDVPDLSIIHRHVSTIFKTKPDSVSRNPDFYVSECGAYFGYLHVRSISCQIVFGPVLDLPVSDTMLRDFIREFGLSPDSRKSRTSGKFPPFLLYGSVESQTFAKRIFPDLRNCPGRTDIS